MLSPEHGIAASGLRTIRALEAVPAVETALFVAARVPRKMHLLEVGCGTGELAMLLGRVGFAVTAVEACPESVRSARAKGVDVYEASWPDFDVRPAGRTFDVVFFNRSLHHMNDLPGALERARDLTIPAGMLLVEDFAHEALEPATAGWVREGLQRCAEKSLFRDTDCLAVELAAAPDADAAVAAWRRRHGDDLQTSRAIDAAIRATFGQVQSSRCPYFYRYVAKGLAPDRTGFLALREWLACEQAAIIDGEIAPVGRRWVARNV